MTKHKKTSRLTASLLLAPALALGTVYAEAQTKTAPTVSRTTLQKAVEAYRPQEAIRQAEVLINRALKTHNFPLLLEAELVRWEQLLALDPSKPTEAYQRLAELAKLPWLSPTDQAVLSLVTMQVYLGSYHEALREVYRDSLDSQRPQRQSHDPIDPLEWPLEQFHAFYTQRVDSLLSDPALLTQSLQPYLTLFLYHKTKINQGCTIASELLGFLSNLAPEGFEELRGKALRTLQTLDKTQLPAFTASLIDQQSVIDRLKGLDACARKTAQGAELEGFVQRWGKDPVINDYYYWLVDLILDKGLARAHALEALAREATGLDKDSRKTLAREIQQAREATFRYDMPERLVGHRDFTITIPSAYLVREVRFRLYPAPAGYNAALQDWRVSPGTKPIWEGQLSLPLDSLGLLPKAASVSLSLPAAGAYRLVLSYTQDGEARGKLKDDRQDIYCTDFVALEHHKSGRSTLQWFEALTGRPLAGATFASYERQDWDKPLKPLGEVKADAWGRFSVDRSGLFHLAGSRDPLLAETYSRRSRELGAVEAITDPQALEGFVTADRPAYRPGQTARFYGIISRLYLQAERAEVVGGLPLEVTIQDASGNQVHSERVSTDALGRFSLSYALPSTGLTGRYHLSVAPVDKEQGRSSWSTAFEVFEYKRSDSQLLLDSPQLPLSAGSKLTVTGSLSTLSGSPIAGAKVKYTLEAKRYFWRFFGRGYRDWQEKTFSGDVDLTTDADGRFSLPLTLPELAPSDKEFFRGRCIAFPWYSYELRVTTTDATGQVHTEMLTLPAGRAVAEVTPSLATLIDKQTGEQALSFEAYRSGEDVRLSVRYSIQQAGRTLLADSLEVGEKANLAQHLRRLAPGRYELHYSTDFSDSLSYAGSQAFYLFDSHKLSSFSDLRAPLLLSAGDGEYSASKKPTVYWTSSLPEAYVFYEVYTGQGQLAEGLLRPVVGKMNALPIDLSKQKELPEEVHVRLWTVRDGRLIEERTSLRRTQPKKTLAIHWESFRDRLRAGEQETWRLSLRTPDGKPASGTAVAAWMYDSALDAFGTLPRWRPQLRLTRQAWGKYGNRYTSYLEQEGRGSLKPLTQWYERWQAEQAQGKFAGSALPSQRLLAQIEDDEELEVRFDATPLSFGRISARTLAFNSSEQLMLESVAVPGKPKAKEERALGSAKRSPEARPQLRTSFAENAFFLPQLTTDAKGEVAWSFTAPERLSSWRLYILAHTRGMDHQTEVQTIQTFRPFSIRPALPRFLSEGDSVSLITEVRNDSEQSQQGKLILELFDPQSEAVLHREETTFDVPRGKSQAYSLPFAGFAGRDSVGIRIWARGAEASDGEQHLLPVRSARQRLTERLAFTHPIAGRDSLSLLPLLPKGGGEEALRDGQLSLQVSSHAAFFTLSALQGLSVSQDASAFARATSLYAHTLVQALRSLDGMKGWARTRVENASFDDLSKRPSLQQTPWARVSDQEKEDELALARQLLAPVAGLESDRLLRQLEGLQDKQGLWSWYPGMQGSTYTTEAVLRILLRLPADRLEQAHRLRLSSLVKAGLSALEKELSEDYARFTSKKDKSADPFQRGVAFLALATEGQRLGFFTPSDKAKPVTAYLLGRLKKEAHRLPLWQKPDVARILLSSGERKLAESLAQSLREHLVTDETGSFFASLDASPYSWIDRTLPTVVGTIQLLRQLGEGTSPEVEGMIRWVINQKRTSSWANELVSADAIHTLLLGDTTSLAKGFSHVMVQVPLKDGMQLTAAGQSIATTLPLSELSSKDPHLTIQQDKPGIVWGSAVASYTVPTAAVKHEGGKELRLRRETFLVREEGGKEVLLPLSDGHQLRVGDRLRTSIVIEVGRSIDFLRLEDPRIGFAEPIAQMPGYAWGDGTGYYYEPKDQTTAFYIDHLSRGSYRVSYDQRVARSGLFHGGVTELVSCYAPEFGAHTAVAPTETVLPLSRK